MPPLRSARLFLIGALALALFSAVHAPLAAAAGTFISAPSRVDMVYDGVRDLLYITNGSQVLRYHLGSASFLAPLQLSGSLRGIDLSPDGNVLAIADGQRTDPNVWIHLVDLTTGQSRKVLFPRASYEGGTFTVAYAGDGSIVVSSSFEGSGWVPLRRYNPANNTTTTLGSVRQDSMLSASADGGTVAFAESNSSDGPWGEYDVASGVLTQRSGYTDGTSWFNYEVGVSRNGSQFALPTYGGAKIYDASYANAATVGQYAGQQPIGVAYHPSQNLVYFAWAGTSEVRAHNTAGFAQTAAYNVGYTFSSPGNHAFVEGRLKIARDGSVLFVTVGGGVRCIWLTRSAPTDTPTHTPTKTPTATVTPTSTTTPSSTPTSTVTSTALPTITVTPIKAPTSTATGTAVPTNIPTTTPISTATPVSAGYTVSINNGALYTNKVAVTLSIGAPADTQAMQVSNDGGFAQAVWEPYQATKAWQITHYRNYVIPRVVYMRFKDAGGGISHTVQDDILLDETPPHGDVRLQSLDPSSRAGVLALAASDGESGVAAMRLSGRPDFAGSEWEPYAAAHAWSFAGGGRAYLQVRDNAGNLSAVVSAQSWLMFVPLVR